MGARGEAGQLAEIKAWVAGDREGTQDGPKQAMGCRDLTILGIESML
jgi:hypothetical protein